MQEIAAMNAQVRDFYKRARKLFNQESDVPDLFVHFLTNETGANFASVKSVRECFGACDVQVPSWLASHFSKGLKKPRRFIKVSGGYRLEHKRGEEITRILGGVLPEPKSLPALTDLLHRLSAGHKRDFLEETVLCLKAGASRATIVMAWNLTVHHLRDYVLADSTRLTAFNTALSASNDKRVKGKVAAKEDDFADIPESLLLLFVRQANLLSASMHKMLQTHLDTRNSAAHPSGLKVSQTKAQAYVEDLTENILLKFSA